MQTKLKFTIYLLVLIARQTFAQCPLGNTATVTSTADVNISTVGTLRWAINCVNTTPALTNIAFSPGVALILPNAQMLTLSKNGSVLNSNSTDVTIDGSNISVPANGISLGNQNVTVQNLTVRNFFGSGVGSGAGITTSGNGHTIQNNTTHSNRVGIALGSTSQTFTVSGNTVGLDGGSPAANSSHGIEIGSPATSGVVSGNTIAHNTGSGVALLLNGTVLISSNIMYCNIADGISRPGGPAAPAITKATTQRIRGTAVAGQVIEVFEHSTAGCSGSIPCQGKNLIGTTTTLATGIWILNLNPGDAAAGSMVTATATQGGTNTSKFAACATVINCAALDANATQTDVTCAGDSDGSAKATPSGGSGPYSYLWDVTGETTATISNLGPGDYNVTVTDTNGCTVSETTTVDEPPALSGTVTATDETAVGANDGTAKATPGGGTPPYTYFWSNNATTQTITGLTPGTYSVTITDFNACTFTDVVTVSSFSCAGFTVAISGTNITCNGLSNGTATATPGGGTPAYNYVWNTGGTLATLPSLGSGNYTVTVTDNAGCIIIQNISLSQPPALGVTMGATPETTLAAHDGTASASGGGGTPGYTYAWNTGSISAVITNLAPGAYTVTVTDLNGCTRSGSATVAPGAGVGACTSLPVYALISPSQVCGNTTLSLETDDLYPSPDVDYIWYFPNGDSAITSVSSFDLLVSSTDFSGEYFVVRDSAGCRSIPVGGAPVQVLSLAPNEVFAGTDTVVCNSGVVVLQAGTLAQGTGNWVSLGDATVDNPGSTLTAGRNIQPGANPFLWRISIGDCPEAATDTVVYFLEKQPFLGDDYYVIRRAQDVAVMEVLLNDALAGLQDTVVYQLSAPAIGQLEAINNGRRFRYTVDEDFRGTVSFLYAVCDPGSVCGFPCDTATVTIEIQNRPSVPEGLIVNDPGLNGELIIKGIKGFSRVEMSIFNRWGALVFQEKNYDNEAPWRGTFQGKPLPQAAYYYYLKAFDGEKLVGGVQTGVIHVFENE